MRKEEIHTVCFVKTRDNICILIANVQRTTSKKIYSNKKETSHFHSTVSFDLVKMLQQK